MPFAQGLDGAQIDNSFPGCYNYDDYRAWRRQQTRHKMTGFSTVIPLFAVGKEDKKVMCRRIYWLILLNPLCLLLYGYGLYILYQLCKIGGVRRRVPILAAVALVGGAWVIGWTVAYFYQKRRKGAGQGKTWQMAVLIFELVALLSLIGYYGYRIAQTAQQFSGKLGNFLYMMEHKKQVELTDRDFYQYGIDGVLRALQEDCGLDSESDLYAATTFVLSLDGQGMIQTVEAYLYAYDAQGALSTYLISYDAQQSDSMTVWLDGNASMERKEQQPLAPMLTLVDALLDSSLLQDGEAYALRYSGYAQGAKTGLWYTLAADGSLQTYDPTRKYFPTDGFLLTVSCQDVPLFTLITQAGSMSTIAEEEAQKEREETVAQAQSEGGTLVTDGDEMTFYLDETHSMSLTVTDAAAGSRFYAFQNGEIYNEDPCDGRTGVAESIYFLDGSVGFILLTNASGDSSTMYYTNDGGATFNQVELPLSAAADDVAGNDFGYTLGDMDYIETPYEEDGVLYVRVSSEWSELDYIVLTFRSVDRGQSWEYVSCSQQS